MSSKQFAHQRMSAAAAAQDGDEVQFCNNDGEVDGFRHSSSRKYTVYSMANFVPDSCGNSCRTVTLVLLVVFAIVLSIALGITGAVRKSEIYEMKVQLADLLKVQNRQAMTDADLLKKFAMVKNVSTTDFEFLFQWTSSLKYSFIKYLKEGKFCPSYARGLYYSEKLGTVLQCQSHRNVGITVLALRTYPFDMHFNRSLEEYKTGFGTPDKTPADLEELKFLRAMRIWRKDPWKRKFNTRGEYFLGLDAIHDITNDPNEEFTLTITMHHRKIDKWTKDPLPLLHIDDLQLSILSFKNFQLGNESDGYVMTFDSIEHNFTFNKRYNNKELHFYGQNATFSSYDFGKHSDCASKLGGGWWFKNCTEELVLTTDCLNFLSYEGQLAPPYAVASLGIFGSIHKKLEEIYRRHDVPQTSCSRELPDHHDMGLFTFAMSLVPDSHRKAFSKMMRYYKGLTERDSQSG